MKKKLARCLLYFSCGVILAGIFFVLTFPYQELEKRIEAELRTLSGGKATIEGLSFAFPFGLAFESVSLEKRDISLSSGRVIPSLTSLASRKIGIGFRFKAWDGETKGNVGLFPISDPVNYEVELVWSGIEVDRLPLDTYLQTLEGLSGTCAGRFDLAMNRNDPLSARGKGEMTLNNGEAALILPGALSLRFEELQARGAWKVKERSLYIDGVDFKAKGLQGEAAGTIALDPIVMQSGLRIQGNLKITPAHPTAYSLVKKMLGKTRMGFSLLGKLGQPKYRLNS